jgi:hypothetical protein
MRSPGYEIEIWGIHIFKRENLTISPPLYPKGMLRVATHCDPGCGSTNSFYITPDELMEVARKAKKMESEAFIAIRDRIIDETVHLSSIHQVLENSSVKDMIAHGELFVPYILNELKKKDPRVDWSVILYKMLGEGPTIPKEHRGKLAFVTKAWIEFLEKRISPRQQIQRVHYEK